MAEFDLLQKICKVPGAPGFEQRIRSFLMSTLEKDVDDMRTDAMGNLITFHKGHSRKKLLLTAHMDEIAFIVQHIDDEGFIRFLPLGGFDPKTLTAQRVIIHGKEDIHGVMGSKPLHIMNAEERAKAPSLKDFFIDTGLTKAEVVGKIQIGDPITREREMIRMGKCINCKSLDNRVSVYILVELMKKLKKTKAPLDVYAVFTVQEEVGSRGSMIAANSIAPDVAINIDTTIAYDVPGAQSHEYITKLGNGVAIKLFDSSVIPDYRMVQFLKSAAEKNKIPWQAELLTGGGTDTASVQRAGNGTIAGAISIPTRHIHQVIEMVHEDDIDAAVRLLEAAVQELENYSFEFKYDT
ncbi:MAG: M42 family metallopeptidase [Saprospiraceae bacterium]|nr:M42 family metallopeptidase [Saprospiraceae bacterium]